MQNLAFADRRIFQRLPVEFPLKYLALNTSKEGDARTLDISGNGMGLVTNQELPRHTPVDIWLNIPDNGEPFYAKAEVAWSKSEANQYRAGVEFKKADFMGLSRVLRIIRERKNKSPS